YCPFRQEAFSSIHFPAASSGFIVNNTVSQYIVIRQKIVFFSDSPSVAVAIQGGGISFIGIYPSILYLCYPSDMPVILKDYQGPGLRETGDTPCALKRAVNAGAVICLVMLFIHMEMSQRSVHSESLCLQPELVSSAPGLSLAAFQPPIIYVSGIFRVIPVSGVFMEIIQTG